RHTRSKRDWSSDVCSSDLLTESRNPAFEQPSAGGDPAKGRALIEAEGCIACHALRDGASATNRQSPPALEALATSGGCLAGRPRSEERRVGKGRRAREAGE